MRSEHQNADGPAAVGVAVSARVKALKDGQHECGRLASARLGAREQVAAGKDMWDGFALHGRGLCIALLRDNAEEFGREPDLVERHEVLAPDEALPP